MVLNYSLNKMPGLPVNDLQKCNVIAAGAGFFLAEERELSYNRDDIPLERNMEKFIIEGGVPLNGEVTPAGNKNAALPLLAATLLTNEPVVLRNVPQIEDTRVMRQLIESLGAQIEDLDATSWRITARATFGLQS